MLMGRLEMCYTGGNIPKSGPTVCLQHPAGPIDSSEVGHYVD